MARVGAPLSGAKLAEYPQDKSDGDIEKDGIKTKSYLHSNNLKTNMHVLFVPTLGLDVSLLDRLAASVDYHVRSKCVFNNGEPGSLDGFRDTHDDWIVKESAFGNLGVAGAWNQCAKMLDRKSVV